MTENTRSGMSVSDIKQNLIKRLEDLFVDLTAAEPYVRDVLEDEDFADILVDVSVDVSTALTNLGVEA